MNLDEQTCSTSENKVTYGSLPPCMKRSAKGLFLLPELMRQNLLPSPNLSIKSFTDFTLPPQHSNPTEEPHHLSQFFSKEPPCVIIDAESFTMRLQHLPIPDVTTIQQLSEFGRKALLDGYQSVRYAHLPPGEDSSATSLPLWVITFWGEVTDIKTIATRWIQCCDWIKVQLKQKKSPGRRQLAEQASIILTVLPWGQKKPQGLSSRGDPIHLLWRYLGPHWLSDSEQNEMLELIQDRYLGSPEKCSQFRVENTYFPAKLLEAFAAGTDSYLHDPSFLWLRQLGDDLNLDGATLITIVHLGALSDMPHWVPLTIQRTRIQFGDSFGTGMPEKLQTACLWWLRQHRSTPDSRELIVPSIHALPITSQVDGHSCGILADNALDHYVCGIESPLLGGANSDIIAQRLKRFITVSRNIIARLQGTVIPTNAPFNCEERTSPHLNTPLPPGPCPSGHCFTDDDISMDFDFFGTSFQDEVEPYETNSPSIKSSPPLPRMQTPSEWDLFKDDDPMFDEPMCNAGPALKSKTHPSPPPPHPLRKTKITSFWKVATPEEKEEMNQTDFQKIRDTHEEVTVTMARDSARKLERGRALARERQQAHRDRSREEKVALGWVPGQKRKRTLSFGAFDTAQKAESSQSAENSRPRRQFKEDRRLKNKPAGRKRKNEQTEAKLMNWFTPFLWSQIEGAAARAGKPWSPRAIVREAQQHNKTGFSRLTEQVLGRWIDPDAKKCGVSCWKESVLDRVKRGNAPGGDTTRVGILDPYVEVRESIKKELISFREAGAPLWLISVRALMVAIIQTKAPELFTAIQSDGTCFKCSDSFVRKFLHQMGWSERRATKAAQKLPSNYEEILTNAFLREAYAVRDHAIPAALRTNTDQTQMVYQSGADRTWNESGVKQVSTVGQEEKRAFTLVPSISASGVVLPMQAIFMGKTQHSCPGPKAPFYAEACQLGFQMLPSKTSTYWSTQETMQTLVDTIIAPYFEKTKLELGLPPTQCSIWKIDCWSVHKSAAFLGWMKKNHSNIIVIFVPGGCTGLWQPLDVGIQRIMKLSVKRAAHRDIVDEISAQLASGAEIRLDVTLGTLRDRAVGWVVNAIRDISDPAIAFELCRVGPFNLSHASITSPEALSTLRNLSKTNPLLFKELSRDSDNMATEDVDSTIDSEPAFSDVIEDASDIPINIVQHYMQSENVADGFVVDGDGSLVRVSAVEDVEFNQEEDDWKKTMVELPLVTSEPLQDQVLGKGHRIKKAPKPYGGADAWSVG